jgi:hypothetical protein
MEGQAFPVQLEAARVLETYPGRLDPGEIEHDNWGRGRTCGLGFTVPSGLSRGRGRIT